MDSNWLFSDLTEAEKTILATIRRRKAELVEQIDTIRCELGQVNAEIESLDIVDDELVEKENKNNECTAKANRGPGRSRSAARNST